MAEGISLSIYIDRETLAQLDDWANEEVRSRSNLVQLIIAEALDQRRKKRLHQGVKTTAVVDVEA